MIDYKYYEHEMEMTCDTCQDVSTFIGAFKECIIDAKEEGWKIVHSMGNWLHYCPMCSAKKAVTGVFNDTTNAPMGPEPWE